MITLKDFIGQKGYDVEVFDRKSGKVLNISNILDVNKLQSKYPNYTNIKILGYSKR